MPADTRTPAEGAVASNVRSFERSAVRGATQARDTRARVIIRTRLYWVKVIGRFARTFDTAGVSARRWWVWTNRPPALRTIWRMSSHDPGRVFAGNAGLDKAWRISNWTERPLMFVLVALAPGFLQPLLRWAFQRPTRRAAFWLVCALTVGGLAAVHYLGRS